MSRRTSEATKAVQVSWVNEKKLVEKGKGTRNWTPEQQKSILEKGKAYDEDGKAIEGHHMKSAEAYPEYQGDSGNIQFLSRTEHLAAHKGNTQNPTNGFYNPLTDETVDFGDNTYTPCEAIELSHPIVVVEDTLSIQSDDVTDEEVKKSAFENKVVDHQRNCDTNLNSCKHQSSKDITNIKRKSKNRSVLSRKSTINLVAETFAKKLTSQTRHPYIHTIIKRGIELLPKAISVASIIYAAYKGIKVIDNSSADSDSADRSLSYNYENSNDDDILTELMPFNESIRSSPVEHTVKSHGQHYNKGGQRVWKEKDSYPRGVKRDE